MADSEQLQTTNEGEEVDDEILNNFFTQIKEKKVEKKIVNTRPELPCKYEDKNHLIDHLCRPAAKYGNLNPFDVLDLDFECQESDVMTRYRKLAKMCHPDRNFDRADDASKAYQAITKAKDFLLAEGNKGLCISIVEQAKDFVTNSMENKRLLLRKQGLKTKLLEDDRNQYFEAVKKRVSVIFADMELMKEVACKKERDRIYKEKESAEIVKKEAEHEKKQKAEYESGRSDRIRNWRDFKSKNKLKKAKHYRETNMNKPLPQKMVDSFKSDNPR